MHKTTQKEWDDLWKGICELSSLFEEGIIFIGGVAVYLHIAGEKLPTYFREYSHDGDFYISLADYKDLREIEEVTQNKRLEKSQIIKNGIDFDIYLEHNNTLRVTYEDAQRYSVVVENVRIACLEHLLVLKMDAYIDRYGSAKGSKDERDLIRIVTMLGQTSVRKKVLQPYLTEEAVVRLAKVARSPEFMAICQGNAHTASILRKEYVKTLSKIEQALP